MQTDFITWKQARHENVENGRFGIVRRMASCNLEVRRNFPVYL